MRSDILKTVMIKNTVYRHSFYMPSTGGHTKKSEGTKGTTNIRLKINANSLFYT